MTVAELRLQTGFVRAQATPRPPGAAKQQVLEPL